jgi:hypothetical protein
MVLRVIIGALSTVAGEEGAGEAVLSLIIIIAALGCCLVDAISTCWILVSCGGSSLGVLYNLLIAEIVCRLHLRFLSIQLRAGPDVIPSR